ncbi:MAG: indole-3-glycerol phosphate synthase TrpC [Candidatus Rokubacteria bacterium]|nr:indole-3-glycerol phosphate synthase TrpC [Candidatus Rokubacteria bacterium]
MTILDRIVRDKYEELEERKGAVPQARLAEACRALGPARDFEGALAPAPGTIRVIAELKKASPSRGVLAEAFDPVALARVYDANGAAAISVLTDERHFQGRLELLGEVRAAVRAPLLRKDFTIDEYQLWEARAAGADAVLLIVAILEEPLLADLLSAAQGLGLAALVEAHTGPEVDSALRAGARILGVNNRDLKTFETRIETTLDLLPRIPPGPIVISESGFFTAADVRRVAEAGVGAILVGEALVRASDPAAKLRELVNLMGGPDMAPQTPQRSQPARETRAGARHCARPGPDMAPRTPQGSPGPG